jgi:glycosyltransferase involved in cell wall biosynthesis
VKPEGGVPRYLLITPNHIGDASGGSIRSTALRAALAELGEVHTVVFHPFFCEKRDEDWREGLIRYAVFTHRGHSLRALGQRRRLRRWIGDLIDTYRYDLIIVCFLSTLTLVPRKERHRVVADADDALKIAPSGRGWRETAARMAVFARNFFTMRAARNVRHVWIVNPADANHLRVAHQSLLRNAVPFPKPDRVRATSISGRVLFVGLMGHAPNLLGLRWFVAEVFPSLRARYPEMELHVIGKHGADFAAEFSRPQIQVRGFVADLAPEYDQAQLVIAPVFTGGGTQIKVIDALAHGRPLVASEFAFSGFARDLREPEHLLVARDRRQWVDQCTWVLENREASESMAARGRAAIADYDVRSMMATVRQTVSDLIGTRSTGAAGELASR